MISVNNKNKWRLFLLILPFLVACQKEGDVIDRFLKPTFPTVLTTIFSDGSGNQRKDSIFWYQDQNGRVDSAFMFNVSYGKRTKIFHVDRSKPGEISIDDADERYLGARILFNAKKQPYKVIFYDRMSGLKYGNSYNFSYGSSFVPDGLETYIDSQYSSMTMEAYGLMPTSSPYHYPMDSLEKISTKLGSFYSGHVINNIRRGDDVSGYSFIPFVSQVVCSNLVDRTPSTISMDIFDAYIWGEIMRPWLSKRLVMSFDAVEFYPNHYTTPFNYSAQVQPKKIIYSDGQRTITNYYP
jgi:hypothetical protein